MDTIDSRIILDAGVASLHANNPDALVRRSAMAALLVSARAVRSVEAGLLAFRIWASPDAKAHPPTRIFDIANEKAPQA